MVCVECGKEIKDTGYFSTFKNKERKDYHKDCKPIFIFIHAKKEPIYREIINGKEWL